MIQDHVHIRSTDQFNQVGVHEKMTEMRTKEHDISQLTHFTSGNMTVTIHGHLTHFIDVNNCVTLSIVLRTTLVNILTV